MECASLSRKVFSDHDAHPDGLVGESLKEIKEMRRQSPIGIGLA